MPLRFGKICAIFFFGNPLNGWVFSIMADKIKLTAGLLGLALTAMTAQAAAPALSYEVTGNNLILTYTGTLLQSERSYKAVTR